MDHRRKGNLTSDGAGILTGLALLMLAGAPASAVTQQVTPLDALLSEVHVGETRAVEGGALTLHQKDAGTPDARGSYLAHSAQGGFSARFPAKFNDVHVSAKTKDGAADLYSNMLISINPADGNRYMAGCDGRSDSKVERYLTAKAMEHRFRIEADEVKQQPFSLGEISGTEYDATYPNGFHLVGRFFELGDNRFCQLTVLFRGPPPKEMPAAVRTLFESFRLKSDKPAQ